MPMTPQTRLVIERVHRFLHKVEVVLALAVLKDETHRGGSTLMRSVNAGAPNSFNKLESNASELEPQAKT